MQTDYIISIRAKDRVGIVSDIASAIRDLGGNIDDSRQSVLRGYFTMILLASFPPEVEISTIQATIATAEVHVGINTAEPDQPNDRPLSRYVLTARGTDRIGLVADVAGFCTQNKINILDLRTLTHRGDYIMMCFVDLTEAEPLVTVRWNLQRFSKEHKLSTTLQHQDIFKATNEIS